MLKKVEKKREIIKYLSILQYYIENSNAMGEYDINTHCEEFFREFLNILFDLELVNLNKIKVNFPAVDLGDIDAGVCYQVTTTSESDKIKTTLEKFNDHKLYNDYEEINVLILGNKKDYSFTVKEYENFSFDINNNILDFKDLIKSVDLIKKNSTLDEIIRMLKENLMNLGCIERTSILSSVKKEEIIFGEDYHGFTIEYCRYIAGKEDELIEQTKADIEYFAVKLSKLDIKTREVIKLIIDNRKIYNNKNIKYDKIYFDSMEIQRITNVKEELQILYKNNFIHPSDYSGYGMISDCMEENYDILYCMDSGNNWNVLYDIVDYCYENSLDIDKIILNLDFTILD